MAYTEQESKKQNYKYIGVIYDYIIYDRFINETVYVKKGYNKL